MLRREEVSMSNAVRLPVVAGQFYPGKARDLEREIASYTRAAGAPVAALGCIVPHAGYVYSGPVAGAVFARLKLARRFVIMCPNHTGMGERLAILSAGEWQTPLGRVKVDCELAELLKNNCDLLAEDSLSQAHEHAIEVQLPFLQKLAPPFTFVPITVGTGRYELLERLGKGIAAALDEIQEPALVIASSDMNHYESDEITRLKDQRALEAILRLDPRGLHEVVTRQQISMCGYGPAVAMLTAAVARGARRAELVKYATSGDISGDRSAVVGYAGVIVR
jgi:hypothetical protein